MGRSYTVSYSGTITAAGGDTDLLEILPTDDKPVKLAGFILSQISEVKDAEEEGLRISVLHMTATVTGGNGTAVTPTPIPSDNTAAGFVAECNGPTVATTSGATTTIAELGWNVRNTPFDFWFPEAFQPKAKQTEALFVRLQTTLADDLTACLTFFLIEE